MTRHAAFDRIAAQLAGYKVARTISPKHNEVTASHHRRNGQIVTEHQLARIEIASGIFKTMH